MSVDTTLQAVQSTDRCHALLVTVVANGEDLMKAVNASHSRLQVNKVKGWASGLKLLCDMHTGTSHTIEACFCLL